MAATAIAAFFPSVISKSIFAPRRADKSFEADVMPVSIMNAGIAALQIAKLGEGVSAIANEGKTAVTEGITRTEHTLKELSKSRTNSIFEDAKKLGKACVKHINVNGCIGGVALIDALYDENPDAALIQNGAMFGSMLAGEGAHKLICGSSSSSRENGVNNIEVKEGLYRKSKTLSKAADSFVALCEKQEEAWKDCGEIKKFVGKVLKYVPSGAKGLSFAGASIGVSALGYWVGGKLAKEITGKEPNASKQAKIVDINPTQKAKEVNINTSYRQAV